MQRDRNQCILTLMIYVKSLSQNVENSVVDTGDTEFNDTDWFYGLENDLAFFHYSDDYLTSLHKKLNNCTVSRLAQHYRSLDVALERCKQSKRFLNRIYGMEHELLQSSRTMIEVRELEKLNVAIENLEAELHKRLGRS